MTAPNPPAFPNDARIQLGADYQGMSLRDWFAGQVAPAILVETVAARLIPPMEAGETDVAPAMARQCYALADAMLAARASGAAA